MMRLLKGLMKLIFIALPLILILGGGAVLWMSRSLPSAAGTLKVEGLAGPITIARDGDGVPHIRATSREDAMTGLGLAHAQDRLWQMEVSRMAGQGRLSEIFGEATLGTDVWLRTIAIYEASVASYDVFPEEGKRALEAYARGVNAWIEREPRFFAAKLPPEFVILRHEPEPWRPEHSVAVVKMMSVGLAANIGDEVTRLALARSGLEPQEIAEVMPLLPEISAPPLPDLIELLEYEAEAQQVQLHTTPPDDIRIGGLTGEGASNNWVVSGERTVTGMPVLANDPHLGLAAPSVWYLAHLRVEGADGEEAENLVGATLAGAPLVLLGRNDNVAWGFTNTGSDVQDLFVERVDPRDDTRYLTPNGWELFGTAEETVRVKGGDDHVLTRRWTRHGPVMPGSYRNLDALLPAGTVGALKWVALARDDRTMMAGLGAWDFETVEDFQEGMEEFITPMQSIVLADTAGNIGLIAPGRVPVRHPDNEVMGRAPAPGWDATYDWQDFIPYEGLPRQLNPESGAIGTANARIVDDDYPHMLTLDWDETYRQRRVEELVIDAEGPHGMQASRAAQADIYSIAFAELMPRMLAAVEGQDVDRFATAALGDWDFRMARERPEPLIAMAWLRESVRAIFADDLGDAFAGWFDARGQVMENVLNGDTTRNWCDRRETDEVENCETILAEALEVALKDLERRYGADRNEWRWGEAHMAVSKHGAFGEAPPLDRIVNVAVESGGGPFTLNRGRTAFGNDEAPFINSHAASYRAVYDLADLDNSTYMITTGQSGNVFSGHYKNFAERWGKGAAITIPTDPARYRPDIVGVWQMVP